MKRGEDFGDEHDPPMTGADALLAVAAVVVSWLAVFALVTLLRY